GASETPRARTADDGRLTTEDWAKAKQSTRRAFFEELQGQLDECWAAHQSLDQAIDEKFGRQTPGLGNLRKTLDVMRTLLGNVVKETRSSAPGPTDAPMGREAAAGENGDGAAEGGVHAVGPTRARQDAYRRLSEVAEYLRLNEPHSPVAYLVQRAIKWGEMPFDLWLEDVIKDGGVLGQLRETLGLGPALQAAED